MSFVFIKILFFYFMFYMSKLAPWQFADLVDLKQNTQKALCASWYSCKNLVKFSLIVQNSKCPSEDWIPLTTVKYLLYYLGILGLQLTDIITVRNIWINYFSFYMLQMTFCSCNKLGKLLIASEHQKIEYYYLVILNR